MERTVEIGDHGLFVDGRRQAGAAQTIDVLNPATGGKIGTIARGCADDVDHAVRRARATFETSQWRRMAHAERGRLLLKLAALVRERENELAQLECIDVGKPLAQALADVRTAARYFEYYGGMADKILGATIPVRWGALDFTLREPYGVSAQIVPWNFPLAMGARGIAPALAAGNCVVAKPAEDASLSVLRLAELAVEAALPVNAFNVVTGYGPEAGAALVRHPLISHITFTGSVATGTAVMTMAAQGIKPLALELGGKSPNIVLADADPALAAAIVARSILVNAGQTCNSCPRLLVQRPVKERLMALLVEKFESLRIGNPLSDPDVGPLVSARHRDQVEQHVEHARADGASVYRYGALPTEDAFASGFYVSPTLVDNVSAAQRIFRDEIFGPVLAITVFDELDEAIALANDSDYGLNAGVFSRDINAVMSLVNGIEAGQLYVNGWGTGGSVEVPFGGYKKSGLGREKGVEGLLHYTQIKAVTMHFG